MAFLSHYKLLISARSLLITSIPVRYPITTPLYTVRNTDSIVKQTTYFTSLRKVRGFRLTNLLQRDAISSKEQTQLEKLRVNNHVLNLATETVTETSV